MDGRLGTARASRSVTDQAIFDGEVDLDDDGREIDTYFGPGYRFYGFGANSEATVSYPSMAANASLIVTKRNDNKRICRCRHYSFLCRDLNLPCSASALITMFLTQHPPFIFAEPGDIWIDIRLSTPNRTYVFARPEPESSTEGLDHTMTTFRNFSIIY